MKCKEAAIAATHVGEGVLHLPKLRFRRHFVAWSELSKEAFRQDYWDHIWAWYNSGGFEHVAAYLREVDINQFNTKAPPPKTEAFYATVDANRAPEDDELADVLEALGRPEAVLLSNVVNRSNQSFAEWLSDRKNARRIPHRFESCGYEPVRNPGAGDGKWKIGGRHQAIYGRADLSIQDRITAALKLARP